MSLLERSEVVHRAWRFRLHRQAPSVSFLEDHLGAGQTAIDIGAGKGVYTYWMSRLVGRSGRVFSFEPQPALARYLEKMKASFEFEQLRVANEGLSATGGTREISQPLVNPLTGAELTPSAGAAGSLHVWTSVLDTYLDRVEGRPVHFVRCDVDGRELDVFRGAARTLLSDRPILLIENRGFRSGGGSTEQVFRLLQDLGYEGFFFEGRRRAPISEFDRAPRGAPPDGRHPDVFAFLPEH